MFMIYVVMRWEGWLFFVVFVGVFFQMFGVIIVMTIFVQLKCCGVTVFYDQQVSGFQVFDLEYGGRFVLVILFFFVVDVSRQGKYFYVSQSFGAGICSLVCLFFSFCCVQIQFFRRLVFYLVQVDFNLYLFIFVFIIGEIFRF